MSARLKHLTSAGGRHASARRVDPHAGCTTIETSTVSHSGTLSPSRNSGAVCFSDRRTIAETRTDRISPARQGIALRQPPDHAAGPIPKIALDEIECVSDPEAGDGRVHRVSRGAAARVAEIHVPRCQLAMDPVERRRGQRQDLGFHRSDGLAVSERAEEWVVPRLEQRQGFLGARHRNVKEPALLGPAALPVAGIQHHDVFEFAPFDAMRREDIEVSGRLARPVTGGSVEPFDGFERGDSARRPRRDRARRRKP